MAAEPNQDEHGWVNKEWGLELDVCGGGFWLILFPGAGALAPTENRSTAVE